MSEVTGVGHECYSARVVVVVVGEVAGADDPGSGEVFGGADVCGGGI